MAMPMSLHLAPLPDEPTTQAAMYGPLVLAGRFGSKGLMQDRIYGPLGPDEARAIPVPALSGSGDAPDWVEQVKGQTLAFQTAGQKEAIDLSPFYQIYDERYTVYWKVNRKSEDQQVGPNCLTTRRPNALENFPAQICRACRSCVSLLADSALRRRRFERNAQDHGARGRRNWHGAAGISQSLCGAPRILRVWWSVGRKKFAYPQHQWLSPTSR
ncbi:MAG: hypothetical protein DMG39_12565 [Acidobacteria bacterium]|nr:MAG: hypothetical protein DMG39_12565 [Acidobacteriota bacterium]